MLDHDAADDVRAFSYDDPYKEDDGKDIADETIEERDDRIERQAYRQSSQVFARCLAEFASYILNHKNAYLATWVVCYALGLPPAQGKTLEEIGKKCGLKTRQCIQREVKKFCDATGFRVATPMRSQEARDSSRESRIASILENQDQ